MKTRHLLLLSVLAGMGNVPMAWAQAAPTAPITGPTSNNPAPPASIASDKPKRARVLSEEVSASISAAMPKYNPQAAKAAEPKPESELPDLRETDKPRNTIIRLPEHVVREKAPPVLRERDVYTKSGLGEIAVRRYITDVDKALNRYRIPLFSPVSFGTGTGNATTDRALAMYAEDERLQNMSDLSDAAALVSASDKSAGLYIKREAQKTYLRHDDFGYDTNSSRK